MRSLPLRALAGAALALAFAAAPAAAQSRSDKSGTIIPGVGLTPHQASGAYAAATVGTSDQTVLSGATAFYFLDIVNLSPTATVCVNFGAAATISGTACAAGEVTLSPLWHRSWEGTFVPTDAIHAISSAASTPISVGAN
jgi:hypothetical protein